MTLRYGIVMLGVIVAGTSISVASLDATAPGIDAGADVLEVADRLNPPTTPPPTAPAASAPGSGPAIPSAAWDAAQAALVVDLVNDERVRRGLRPLVVSPQLDAAAAAHASDLRTRPCSELGHTGSDGSRVGDRVTRTGFRWSAVGENLACAAWDARTVVDLWLGSEAHRRNIFHPDFTHVGMSMMRSDAGVTYWVQVFAIAG